jgi:hypothetical protein
MVAAAHRQADRTTFTIAKVAKAVLRKHRQREIPNDAPIAYEAQRQNGMLAESSDDEKLKRREISPHAAAT